MQKNNFKSTGLYSNLKSEVEYEISIYKFLVNDFKTSYSKFLSHIEFNTSVMLPHCYCVPILELLTVVANTNSVQTSTLSVSDLMGLKQWFDKALSVIEMHLYGRNNATVNSFHIALASFFVTQPRSNVTEIASNSLILKWSHLLNLDHSSFSDAVRNIMQVYSTLSAEQVGIDEVQQGDIEKYLHTGNCAILSALKVCYTTDMFYLLKTVRNLKQSGSVKSLPLNKLSRETPKGCATRYSGTINRPESSVSTKKNRN